MKKEKVKKASSSRPEEGIELNASGNFKFEIGESRSSSSTQRSQWWEIKDKAETVATVAGVLGAYLLTQGWGLNWILTLCLISFIVSIFARILATMGDKAHYAAAIAANNPRFDLPRIKEVSDEELARIASAAQNEVKTRAIQSNTRGGFLIQEIRRLTAEQDAVEEVTVGTKRS